MEGREAAGAELKETERVVKGVVVMPAPFRGDAAAAAPSGTLGPVSGGVGRGVLDVCRGGGWLLAARSVLKRVPGGRESRPCGVLCPRPGGAGLQPL